MQRVDQWRRVCAVLPAMAAVMAVLGWPSLARSADSSPATEEPPVLLAWQAPEGEGCPASRDVLAQVAKLVEASPRSERAAVRVRADVTKLGPEHFQVALTSLVNGQEGRRVIEERSCARMAEATALILAWMVDPNVFEAPRSVLPPERPAQSPSATRVPEPEPRPWRVPRFLIGADALVDVGTLPAVAWGAGLRAEGRWSWFRLLARGGFWASQTAHAPGSTAAGASFQLIAASVNACVAPGAPGDVDFAFCGGPELDHLQGTGFGVEVPRTDGAFWLSLGLGAEGRVRVTELVGITVSLFGALPTQRERFGLDEVGIVHRPGKVALRASLGLDVGF